MLVVAIALFVGTVRAEEPGPAWEFSASVYGYDVPDSEDYVNPNVTADRGRLHLEARYSYEAIGAASVWAGANFSAGTNWVFDSTLMVGGVFGDLEGVAPGYRLSLEHAWFGLASEGEYFIDTHDSEGNYLYSWNEVAGAPTEWFRAGLAVQRTRAYESELDVQRGVFVGFTVKQFDAAAYVFNIGWEDPTYVLSLRYDF
jgi:hypothetical protein